MNHCKDCPFKTECIMGNSYKTPIEERQKVLYVSKIMKQKRLETLERNTSDYGTQQRMKRSIQTEESFASHKRRYGFLPLFSPLFLKFPPRFPCADACPRIRSAQKWPPARFSKTDYSGTLAEALCCHSPSP